MTSTERPARRSGFTINGVLILILVAGLVLSTAVALTVAAETSAAAGMRRARLAAAAEGVVAEMQERLLARAQQLSGALRDEDMAYLNTTALHDVRVPGGGLELEPEKSGWRVIEFRAGEQIPHDEVPIAVWTDQPRLAYRGTPAVGGLVAARTLVVAVYATIRDSAGASLTFRRDLAISQIPPHQHAAYVQGDAEFCASSTPAGSVSGRVRVDGTFTARSCDHLLRYAGGIEARDGIVVEAPSTHVVVGSDGQRLLASVSAEEARSDAQRVLATWGGRVRVTAALGIPVGPGRLSSADVAGSGECDDPAPPGSLACDGAARYFASVQVQRTGSGPGAEFSAHCGVPYASTGCAEVLSAITYLPWPFPGPQPGGVAAADPLNSGFPWKGLLPDARREARCTATAGGNSYRTARCPTNVYGFRIDLGTMPEIAGGVLSIRRAVGQAPGANPTGGQEIVLLTNGSALAGPLTVHSEIPVYVVGNFNTAFRAAFNGPPPAKIHAPRIVVLPNEAPAQLLTSAVWDSVPRAGSMVAAASPLRAETNVTISAVLRTGYCRSAGTRYFGSVWEGAPAVLGDWSSAALHLIGAVEVTETPLAADGCEALAAPVGQSPSGTPTTQPAARTLLYDDRLLHPSFQPPGAWGAGTMAFDGASAVPGRTIERQLRAVGGTVAVRRVRGPRRGAQPLPEAVSIPPAGPVPAAPLPLP